MQFPGRITTSTCMSSWLVMLCNFFFFNAVPIVPPDFTPEQHHTSIPVVRGIKTKPPPVCQTHIKELSEMRPLSLMSVPLSTRLSFTSEPEGTSDTCLCPRCPPRNECLVFRENYEAVDAEACWMTLLSSHPPACRTGPGCGSRSASGSRPSSPAPAPPGSRDPRWSWAPPWRPLVCPHCSQSAWFSCCSFCISQTLTQHHAMFFFVFLTFLFDKDCSINVSRHSSCLGVNRQLWEVVVK